MFSCEYCENFQKTYFEKHLRTAASPDYLMVTSYSGYYYAFIRLLDHPHIYSPV